MAIVISLWVTASIMTQQPLNFVTLFVPMACAGAMAVTAVNRGILFGILAVLLGMAGICAGRAAVVKFAVIPALKVNSQKEILQDLKTMLNDPKQQLPPDLSAKSIVKDGDFMFCVALVAAVDKDDADPAIARKLAIDRLKTSGKSNIFDSLVKATYGPARVNEPNYTDSEAEIIEKAQSHSMEWFENDQQLESARLYYPALNQLCIQTEWIKILENPSKTFMFGFFATLGLLDVLWTLVGLGLGYTTAVFDN